MTETGKTVLGGISYEIIPAEVSFVDYEGTNPEKLYSIRCKILGSFGSMNYNDTVTARPLDNNIKRVPVEGEVVALLLAPTAYGSAISQTREYYYLPYAISVQSSVHHNAIPGHHKVKVNDSNEKKQSEYRQSSNGVSKNSHDDKVDLETIFPERNNVYPLQPYSGDTMLEGRFANSIRFGSTLKDDNNRYVIEPQWKKGNSNPGDPILIISNGHNGFANSPNGFIGENIDLDDSCIFLTSGQEVQYTLASTVLGSLKNRDNNSYETDNAKYAGNQLLGASDRILLNAKGRELLLIGKRGVALATDGNVTIDAGDTVEVEAADRINLGIDADEPALLGDTTGDWLGQFLDQLMNLCTSLMREIHPTGFGPSGPPINAAEYGAVKVQLAALKRRIPELKSELVYLNKYSKGITPK